MSRILSYIRKLKDAFYSLPSVTPKYAEKLTSDFIKLTKEQRCQLLDDMKDASENIGICGICGNFSTGEKCDICADEHRRDDILCVVEEVADVLAVENTSFNGRYHILGGRIDPLNKVLPEDLHIDALVRRLESGKVKEIIIATNLNRKGLATARYLYHEIEQKFPGIIVTQPAHGLSEGSEIGYVNPHTLKEAIDDRRKFQ